MGTKDRKSLIKHIDFIAADIIILELSYFLGNVDDAIQYSANHWVDEVLPPDRVI